MGAIPSNIGAGVTFKVTVNQPNYPAPEWDLELFMRGASSVDLSASADDDQHVLTATAAVTATWKPGRYRYELRAKRGDDTLSIETGELIIAPDLAAQGAGFDGRDHARKVLDAIEAVIEGRASIDQQSYTINNRSLQRTPIADLLKLRDRYRAEVQAKKSARRGFGMGRTIKVRMP